MVTDEKRPTPNLITGCQKNYQIINSLILETSFFSEIHCYQNKVLSSVDLILSDYQFKKALHVWFTTVPFNLTLHGIKKEKISPFFCLKEVYLHDILIVFWGINPQVHFIKNICWKYSNFWWRRQFLNW